MSHLISLSMSSKNKSMPAFGMPATFQYTTTNWHPLSIVAMSYAFVVPSGEAVPSALGAAPKAFPQVEYAMYAGPCASYDLRPADPAGNPSPILASAVDCSPPSKDSPAGS